MATHSSIFVWRIPGTEEPGGLKSQRVKHYWVTNTHRHRHLLRASEQISLGAKTIIWSFFLISKYFGCTGSSLWCLDSLVQSLGSRLPSLSTCGKQASLAVPCGFSCPAGCGILVPWPGIEPESFALEGKFLTTGPPRKSYNNLIFIARSAPLDHVVILSPVIWGPDRHGFPNPARH